MNPITLATVAKTPRPPIPGATRLGGGGAHVSGMIGWLVLASSTERVEIADFVRCSQSTMISACAVRLILSKLFVIHRAAVLALLSPSAARTSGLHLQPLSSSRASRQPVLLDRSGELRQKLNHVPV